MTSPVDQTIVDAYSITVTGTAHDPDGIEYIRVNGVTVNSYDGYNTWEVRVPLVTGINTLRVEAADTLSNVDINAAAVVIENLAVILARPNGIILDADNDRLLLTDNRIPALVTIELRTGEKQLLSDGLVGADSTHLIDPRRLVLDNAAETAWVFDAAYETLIAVNLADGRHTPLPVSDESMLKDVGLYFVDLALASSGETAYVLLDDVDGSRIIAVDLTTGAQNQLAFGGGDDDLDPFYSPASVVYDSTLERILIFQNDHFDFNAPLVTINPMTGDRQSIQRNGYRLNHPIDTVFDEVNYQVFIVDRVSSRILRMALNTNEVDVVVPPPMRDEPARITLDNNGKLFVLYRHYTRIDTVDIETGEVSAWISGGVVKR